MSAVAFGDSEFLFTSGRRGRPARVVILALGSKGVFDDAWMAEPEFRFTDLLNYRLLIRHVPYPDVHYFSKLDQPKPDVVYVLSDSRRWTQRDGYRWTEAGLALVAHLKWPSARILVRLRPTTSVDAFIALRRIADLVCGEVRPQDALLHLMAGTLSGAHSSDDDASIHDYDVSPWQDDERERQLEEVMAVRLGILQVLIQAVTRGSPVSEIAEAAGLAEHTVKTYLSWLRGRKGGDLRAWALALCRTGLLHGKWCAAQPVPPYVTVSGLSAVGTREHPGGCDAERPLPIVRGRVLLAETAFACEWQRIHDERADDGVPPQHPAVERPASWLLSPEAARRAARVAAEGAGLA